MIQVWVWWMIWLNCHSSTALPSLRSRKISVSEKDHNFAALKEDADMLEGIHSMKRRSAEGGCKFPFIYKGVSYTKCTTTDDPNGQLWCSINTDNNHNHVKGTENWRHCNDNEGTEVNSAHILNEDFSGRSANLDLVEDAGKLCGVPAGRLMQGRSLMDDFVVQEHKNLAKEGEYPWQVAILSRNMEYRCGGVIVGKRHVITVAHCVTNILAGDIVVRVGDFDLSSDDEEYPSYDIAVRWIKIHPGFIKANLRDDLALLEVKFNMYRLANIGPACLPTPGSLSDVQNCKVPGWGQFVTSVADMGSHTFTYKMRVAGLRTISREMCQSTLRASRKVGAFFKLQNGNICAIGNDGGDTCNGDGGSGLICPNNHQYIVEGLVSWGLGCGLGLPGAYVDVRHYLDWIIEEMDSPGHQSVQTMQTRSTLRNVETSSSSPRPVETSSRSPRPVEALQTSSLPKPVEVTRTPSSLSQVEASKSTHIPKPVEAPPASTGTPNLQAILQSPQPSNTLRPAATKQGPTQSPRPVETFQSTHIPRPVPTSQTSILTPKPVVATSQDPSLITDTITSLNPIVSTIPVETSEPLHQINSIVDTRTVQSTQISNLPLQPPSGLFNHHPRPTNLHPSEPVQPTVLSLFTPSAAVESDESTLEVTISTTTAAELVTLDPNIGFIPPEPAGISSSLETFDLLKPSAADVESMSTIVGPVETITRSVNILSIRPASSTNFVPPKPVAPSSTTSSLHQSTLPLFGNLPPPPPPSSGSNGFQGFDPFNPHQGFEFDPFDPFSGNGLFSPGFVAPTNWQDDYFRPPGTETGILSPGTGAGILHPGPGVGIGTHHGSAPDAGVLPIGPDDYYGPPGPDVGILAPGSGATGAGFLPPGPDVGILAPGSGATGAGFLPPGPGLDAGILPPGPDSYYGPPGQGAGILPTGSGIGAGILPTGSGIGAGILPTGSGTGILPSGPGLDAGVLPSGPDSYYGPPGLDAGILPPAQGAGDGVHPPGPGTGGRILPPEPGVGIGTRPHGLGPDPGVLPSSPDSYYGPPGPGAGILLPGSGAGIPPGPDAGILLPGSGTGIPPGPDAGILPPGFRTGAGILSSGSSGTGAGVNPPDSHGPPGPGAGILPSGIGSGILHPGPGVGTGTLPLGPGTVGVFPDNYGPPGQNAGILPPGTGIGILLPGSGTGAEILPPGPGAGIIPLDSYYGPPGPGAGILSPGSGAGAGILPLGPDPGVLPPGPDSFFGPPGPGVGVLTPERGTGGRKLPPGPDSHFGPLGSGTDTGILTPGPDSYYGSPEHSK